MPTFLYSLSSLMGYCPGLPQHIMRNQTYQWADSRRPLGIAWDPRSFFCQEHASALYRPPYLMAIAGLNIADMGPALSCSWSSELGALILMRRTRRHLRILPHLRHEVMLAAIRNCLIPDVDAILKASASCWPESTFLASCEPSLASLECSGYNPFLRYVARTIYGFHISAGCI